MQEVIAHIIDGAMRAGEVIRRTRSLLKKTAPDKEPLDINETIRGALSLVSSWLNKYQVIVRTELEMPLPPVPGDRIQLQQVLMNLIVSANEAMSGEGWQPRDLLISSHLSSHDEVTVAA